MFHASTQTWQLTKPCQKISKAKASWKHTVHMAFPSSDTASFMCIAFAIGLHGFLVSVMFISFSFPEAQCTFKLLKL